MVVLVNRSLARRTWKNEDAVGKRITFDGEHFLEIVGVVGDVREFGPREDAPDAVVPSRWRRLRSPATFWCARRRTRSC